jgi:hypothetical protein
MEPLDTMQIVRRVRRVTEITSMGITHRWWGKVIVCHIVIGCFDVLWILHFTLYDRISHWLRIDLQVSALLVITSYMRVLRNDTHG